MGPSTFLRETTAMWGIPWRRILRLSPLQVTSCCWHSGARIHVAAELAGPSTVRPALV